MRNPKGNNFGCCSGYSPFSGNIDVKIVNCKPKKSLLQGAKVGYLKKLLFVRRRLQDEGDAMVSPHVLVPPNWFTVALLGIIPCKCNTVATIIPTFIFS